MFDGSVDPPTVATSETEMANRLPLNSASMDLADEIKALINDRDLLVYGSDFPYRGPYEGVVDWWDSIECLQRNIAVGADNEPNDQTGYCTQFCALSDVAAKVAF